MRDNVNTIIERKTVRNKKLKLGSTLCLTTILVGIISNAVQAQSVKNEDTMSYVPFAVSIIGIDKEQPSEPSRTGRSETLYEKRMSMPWSRESFHDEGPAHFVAIDAYMIDKYEVSNGKFKEFMKATGHPAPAYWDDPRLSKQEQPVVGVNYFDASDYCKWEGKRLPTEAEWERAARGPDGFTYPWGNDFDASKANFGKRNAATLPVNSMPEGSSPFGLHHMAGNAFEWVQDWYDPNFYKKTPHPTNTNGPSKPLWLGGTGTYVDRLTTGVKRVIRGGSWIAARGSITTTHRFWNHPSNNSYGVGLGFRCAMSAPQNVVDEVRTLTISAMKNMSLEKFGEAKRNLHEALAIDPTNPELLQMQRFLD